MNEHVWPLDVFHGGRTGLEHLAPTVANSVRIPLPSIFRRFSGAAIYRYKEAKVLKFLNRCSFVVGFLEKLDRVGLL